MRWSKGSSNLPKLDPFAEFSTLVSGDELADQSLPDEYNHLRT